MSINLRTLTLITIVLLLTGCTNGNPLANIPNPFTPSSDVSDFYFSQFPDVPIPRDMHNVAKKTMVTPFSDGTRFGLETFSGRVETYSLSNAMIHNLARQGWALRGSVTGKRIMQLHEKDDRYIVIYISEGTVNTEMEVWQVQRLQQSSLSQLPFSAQGSGANILDQWEAINSYQLKN